MKAHVRVTMDGKIPQRELIYDGVKVGDLTYFEALELALNIVSGLRFEVTGKIDLPSRHPA